MNNKVFISCAVTGSGDTASKHPNLPKTPEQIAKAAIEAAKAGAAIAHIHVRENDGKPSRRLELYKEVVDRVRSSDTDVIFRHIHRRRDNTTTRHVKRSDRINVTRFKVNF